MCQDEGGGEGGDIEKLKCVLLMSGCLCVFRILFCLTGVVVVVCRFLRCAGHKMLQVPHVTSFFATTSQLRQRQ